MTIQVEARILADHPRLECSGTYSQDAVLRHYEQAVRVAELRAAESPRIRLAVIGHEPMIHRERFGEIVATNRGALARAFTDENAALEWLLAPPKSR